MFCELVKLIVIKQIKCKILWRKKQSTCISIFFFFCIGQRGIKELRKRREKGRAIVTRIHSERVNSPAHWSLQPSFGAGSTIVCFFFVDRDERGLGKKVRRKSNTVWKLTKISSPWVSTVLIKFSRPERFEKETKATFFVAWPNFQKLSKTF